MSELIEEINWLGDVVAVHAKDELKKRMFPHKVSLIIPQNKGNLLLCRRAIEKFPFPNTWCCAVGGKVRVSESFENAALREMEEEVGKTVPLRHVTTFAYNKEDYKAMFAIFTTQEDFAGDDLQLDKSEIQFMKFFSIEVVQEMINKSPKEFAPTFLAAIEEFVKRN